MKKMFSLLLALVMCLTLCVPAFASQQEQLPPNAVIETVGDFDYYIERTDSYGLVLCKHSDGRMEVAYETASDPGVYYSTVYVPDICTYDSVRQSVFAGEVPMKATYMISTYALSAQLANIIKQDCQSVAGAPYAYRPYTTLSNGGYSVDIKMMMEYLVEEYQTFYTYMRFVADFFLMMGGSAGTLGKLGLVIGTYDGVQTIITDAVITKAYCFPTTRKTGFINSKTCYTSSSWNRYPYILNTSNLKYERQGMDNSGSDVYYSNNLAIARESVSIYQSMWG